MKNIQSTLSIAISEEGDNNLEKYQSVKAVVDIALRKRWRPSNNKTKWKILFLWWKNTRSRKEDKSKGKNCFTSIRRNNEWSKQYNHNGTRK